MTFQIHVHSFPNHLHYRKEEETVQNGFVSNSHQYFPKMCGLSQILQWTSCQARWAKLRVSCCQKEASQQWGCPKGYKTQEGTETSQKQFGNLTTIKSSFYHSDPYNCESNKLSPDPNLSVTPRIKYKHLSMEQKGIRFYARWLPAINQF